MTPVESYLADLCAVGGAGTAETSGYPALANLLNEVGGALKPKITAVIHPANSGADLPDGGFFSAKELRQHPSEVSLLKLNPERGVLEVKPVEHDLLTLAQTPQVRNYLEHYGQILLTNYRSFALYMWEGGKPVPGESFYIAENEAAFWDIARHAKDHKLLGERLTEYLRRALLNRARLAAPRDLAAYLASYARARVEGAESNALAPVAEALGAALGIKFEGEKGEHFFRSTLIQTLFYGSFSAWVLWNEGNPKARRPLPLARGGLSPRPARPAHALSSARPSAAAPRAGTGGCARLDRGRARPRGTRRLLPALRSRRSRAVFLRALPRRVRPRAAQAVRRLVHPAGDREIHGRPRGSRVARKLRSSRGPREQERPSSSIPAAAPVHISSRRCASFTSG